MSGAGGHAGGVRDHQADEADRAAEGDEYAGEQRGQNEDGGAEAVCVEAEDGGALLPHQEEVEGAGEGEEEGGTCRPCRARSPIR